MNCWKHQMTCWVNMKRPWMDQLVLMQKNWKLLAKRKLPPKPLKQRKRKWNKVHTDPVLLCTRCGSVQGSLTTRWPTRPKHFCQNSWVFTWSPGFPLCENNWFVFYFWTDTCHKSPGQIRFWSLCDAVIAFGVSPSKSNLQVCEKRFRLLGKVQSKIGWGFSDDCSVLLAEATDGNLQFSSMYWNWRQDCLAHSWRHRMFYLVAKCNSMLHICQCHSFVVCCVLRSILCAK